MNASVAIGSEAVLRRQESATNDVARAPRIGLIVNPVSGLGGAVGLKGSDGVLAERARALGACDVAGARAAQMLARLAAMAPKPQLMTVAGEMGERVARAAGFDPLLVGGPMSATTVAADTQRAASAMAAQGVDLLLFVGGDGTARDVLTAVGKGTPVLGVPAGVKMHSPVFATGVRAAADAVAQWWQAGRPLEEADVVDREALGDGAPVGPVRFFGALRVPRVRECLQKMKSAGPAADELLEGATDRIAEWVRDDRISVLGPGTTLRALKAKLGFEGSALGVDVVCRGVPVALDVGEPQLLQLLTGHPARIVLTVVGGQGFVFGRGNQPISARVIRAVGHENIVIVASADKLAKLPESTLLVDTGDTALDRELSGYRAVITGSGRVAICRVRSADP